MLTGVDLRHQPRCQSKLSPCLSRRRLLFGSPIPSQHQGPPKDGDAGPLDAPSVLKQHVTLLSLRSPLARILKRRLLYRLWSKPRPPCTRICVTRTTTMKRANPFCRLVHNRASCPSMGALHPLFCWHPYNSEVLVVSFRLLLFYSHTALLVALSGSQTRRCDTLHLVFLSARLVLRSLIRTSSYAPGHSFVQPGPSLIEFDPRFPPAGH
jgi:hypothetical protein